MIGREFTLRLLERISAAEGELGPALSELKTVELIFEKTWFPELAYMFKHALTHDVAYSTLLAERRRGLHRMVAAAVEDLYADRLTQHYEGLAHHYSEGAHWEKALEFLTRAGDKAAAADAGRDAVDYYARALEVCDELGAAALPRVIGLARRRAFVNFALGRLPDAIADAQRMAQAARALDDVHGEGIALAHRGLFEAYNHQASAEDTLQAALATVDRGAGDRVRATASLYLGLTHMIAGRHAESRVLFDYVRQHASALDGTFTASYWTLFDSRLPLWEGRLDVALERSRRAAPGEQTNLFIRLHGTWNEAHARATAGDYETARQMLLETLASCERLGDKLTGVRCLNTLGYVYGEVNDFANAMEWNLRGLDMARSSQAPVPEVEMNARLNLAENLLGLGRPDEAEEHFRLVERDVRHPRLVWMQWRYGERFFHSFGEWWLARGDVPRARAHADECLAWAQDSGSRKNIVKARRLRGQCHLAGGRLAEAESELNAALELAQEVGSPPQIWKTWAVLGELRRAQGRSVEAREAYGSVATVIDGVAARLTDELRRTFLASEEVRAIRRAAATV